MHETMAFVIQYGVPLLFVMIFAEQAGLPVPAIPLLVAAGALAGAGEMSLWSVAGVASLATLAADGLWYELGRRRGRSVLRLLCRIAIEPDSCIRSTEGFFVKHGKHSLLLAKFVPGLSTIAPPLAGIVGISVPLFLFWDGLGTALWVGSGIGLGYFFSGQLEEAVQYMSHAGAVLAALASVAVVSYILWKLARRYRLAHRVMRVTMLQVAQKLEKDEPILFVDVRGLEEARQDPGIPQAMLIPFAELERRYPELPVDRDLILYCTCPQDAGSAQAAMSLRKKGFNRAWPLAGGLDAWRAWQVAQAPAIILPDRLEAEYLSSAELALR
jgi:membrane protein DedA with SNARE-associated domain/rhodanese-related sulfurtransferase